MGVHAEDTALGDAVGRVPVHNEAHHPSAGSAGELRDVADDVPHDAVVGEFERDGEERDARAARREAEPRRILRFRGGTLGYGCSTARETAKGTARKRSWLSARVERTRELRL